MNSVQLLWINARRSNYRLQAILNSNKRADIIPVQPWFDTINTARSGSDPFGTSCISASVLGTAANPSGKLYIHAHNRASDANSSPSDALQSFFSITNGIDLTSNYH